MKKEYVIDEIHIPPPDLPEPFDPDFGFSDTQVENVD